MGESMIREIEARDYLRADSILEALAPGGIYADSELGIDGITDPKTTPDVWAGGVFNATVVVRGRLNVPTGDLQDMVTQHSTARQVVEVWAYAKTDEAVEAILNRVYVLMLGHAFAGTWGAMWAPGLGIMDAPGLPNVSVAREDYALTNMRKPVAA